VRTRSRHAFPSFVLLELRTRRKELTRPVYTVNDALKVFDQNGLTGAEVRYRRKRSLQDYGRVEMSTGWAVMLAADDGVVNLTGIASAVAVFTVCADFTDMFSYQYLFHGDSSFVLLGLV
jgi:hypothetical protein